MNLLQRLGLVRAIPAASETGRAVPPVREPAVPAKE